MLAWRRKALLQVAPQVFLEGGLGPRVPPVAQCQLCLEHGDLGIALEDLETRIDEVDAIVERLQLGGLVHHVHRRRHLAAIVQQASDLQLVAVLVRHAEIGQRTGPGFIHRLGQHHGEDRHALAVPARVGRLLVDRHVDELDEGLEQFFQLRNELSVGERDSSLRGQ